MVTLISAWKHCNTCLRAARPHAARDTRRSAATRHRHGQRHGNSRSFVS